ncbi:DoxX family membrane protein [Catellatospora sp. KI3]|uniref:DoxX family membrane protein n=1 Tax=Catellatospora sp. KI3 TaxID=3041620 RepID=UPI00248311E5|nr:DoxX family membrane protein [Catellatospora sp. KI3]MDI1461701.1 DoxX family membrane protein [Catellatospora sp. KI3]
MKPVRGVARALLGGIFAAAGAHALLRPERYAEQAAPLAEQVAPLLERVDPRLPSEARSLVRVNGAAQLLGGVLLATGTAPRPAAALLAGTLIPATVVNHPFWLAKDSHQRSTELVQFAKNLGLLGGLLLAAADTAGSPSLGWRANRAIHDAQKSIRKAQKKAVGQLHPN